MWASENGLLPFTRPPPVAFGAIHFFDVLGVTLLTTTECLGRFSLIARASSSLMNKPEPSRDSIARQRGHEIRASDHFGVAVETECAVAFPKLRQRVGAGDEVSGVHRNSLAYGNERVTK